jgi:hypothetical protein
MADLDPADSRVPIKDYLDAFRIRTIRRDGFSGVGAGLR